MQERKKRKATLVEALIPIVTMMVLLVVGVGVYGLRAEPILLLVAFVAGTIAWRLGYSWKEMEKGIVDKLSMAMPAIIILWSVGMLVGSWMYSGAIPMMIYYGVNIVNPKYLLVTAFLIAAFFSTVTGTSWGSVSTVGVAIIGIAQSLGVPLAPTAGAIVGGAYFGDKLSPLSDTTNLAPLAAGSELYEHIRHMLYTTIPATLVALGVYFFVGLGSPAAGDTADSVLMIREQLDGIYQWNIFLLLPVLMILVGSLKKLPTIPTMLGSSFLALFIGGLSQGFGLKNGFLSMVSGFDLEMTGFAGEITPELVNLINRGGAVSMAGTTVLVFCAMGFAGIMSVSGMLDVVLAAIMKRVKSVGGLILSTVLSCVTVAFVTGNSYLSILLPGQLFKDAYPAMNLKAKNLSRTLEDSGTVLVPIIPWSAAGAFMYATLGVPTLEYLPWAVFNYSGIIFALIYGFTGWGIAYEDEKKS